MQPRGPGAYFLLLVIATAAYGCVAILAGRLFGLDLLPDYAAARVVLALGSPWVALGGAALFWLRGPAWEEQLHGPYREGPGAARRRTMRSGETQVPASGQARRIALALAALGGLALLLRNFDSGGPLVGLVVLAGLGLSVRYLARNAGGWPGFAAFREWWRRMQEEGQGAGQGWSGGLGGGDSYQEALKIFGLAEGFSEEELKVRYRELHKRVHPDMGGSTAFAQQLNAAYDILKRHCR